MALTVPDQEGAESKKKAKRARIEGSGDEGNMENEKLGFKKITWKLHGEVVGTSKVDDGGNTSNMGSRTTKHQGRAAMTADGSCSHHRSSPEEKASRSTSTVIAKQCRRPCTTPRRRGLLSTFLQMGVDHPVRAMRKSITRSDIDRQQHRLLLPKDTLDKPLLEGMMTAAEKTKTTEKSGLAFKILDRVGREYNLALRFLTSVDAYRITGPDYNRLVEDKGFQVGKFLDLWVFRVGRGGSSGDETEGAGSTSSPGELGMAIDYEKAEEEIEDVPDDHEGCSCCVVSAGDKPGRTPSGRQSEPCGCGVASDPWILLDCEEEAALALLILRQTAS